MVSQISFADSVFLNQEFADFIVELTRKRDATEMSSINAAQAISILAGSEEARGNTVSLSVGNLQLGRNRDGNNAGFSFGVAQNNRTTVRPRGEILSMSIHHARSVWLLVISIVLCSWLPAAALADEFARTHKTEIQEMVATSVRIETGINTIRGEFAKKALSDPDPSSPSLLAGRRLNRDCSSFIYARFYAKYRTLIDNIDTSPFDSTWVFALRKNKSDTSVLRDPRKIVIDIKYKISGFEDRKDFQPPLEEFVVQYSALPDLEAECAHYLDVTGMRK